ncbi:MAG TPA: galactokinase family protein [Gemmatimonadaceae bacterium]|nr:galactokinase family protein [Gemmatimonadaceae bacterium]
MIDHALAFFRSSFGCEPKVIAFAPGRINLLGEHTDYNGGDALPVALPMGIYVAAAPGTAPEFQVVSDSFANPGRFVLEAVRPTGEWYDIVAGVALALRARGCEVERARLAVVGDLPYAAGLGSSAALAVAASMALAALAGVELSRFVRADIAWEGEAGFSNVPCGRLDQLASSLAVEKKALHICFAPERVVAVPFLQHVLVFDTGRKRQVSKSLYAQRRRECEAALALLRRAYPELSVLARATPEQLSDAALPEKLASRAKHVAEETARVREAAAALARGDSLDGTLLYRSHRSLRDLYECSAPELDWLVSQAERAGLNGCRLTGAGWGGCAVAVDSLVNLREFAVRIQRDFEHSFGFEPRWWLAAAAGSPQLVGV